ncbi:ribonuclease H-like domain-containing protein, partial [Tanacetum coccineum]
EVIQNGIWSVSITTDTKDKIEGFASRTAEEIDDDGKKKCGMPSNANGEMTNPEDAEVVLEATWTVSVVVIFELSRVFENDVKGSTASSSSSQNVAFVSKNTNSTNDVSTAYSVYNTSEQLDEYDLEEMDLKWQMAMISMRMKKFYKKTGRKIQFDAKEPVGFDKTKVECYNCYKTWHFAREYRIKGNQDNRRRDAWNFGNKDGSRTGKKEDSKALVTIDGEGVDWTSHSEEDEDYALIACNSSESDTEDYPHRALKNKGIVDSGYFRHMTGNKAYLAEFQDFNGGLVAFGGSKGYITSKGKIKTGRLDFEDVCFVKELQYFNLFSMSQMCDKKNKVLFTDSECLVLSPEFKLPDENQNQLNQTVKTIRCDNGTEFKNKDVIEFCESKGIKREYSNARTPQQNGVVKERTGTFIEAARTMLEIHFYLTLFVAEAVSTAGKGDQTWLFDLDYLQSDSMIYQPVRSGDIKLTNMRVNKKALITMQLKTDAQREKVQERLNAVFLMRLEELRGTRAKASQMYFNFIHTYDEEGVVAALHNLGICYSEVWILVDLPFVKKAIGTKVGLWKRRMREELLSEIKQGWKHKDLFSLCLCTWLLFYQMDVKSASFMEKLLNESVLVLRFQASSKGLPLSAGKRLFRYLKGKQTGSLVHPREWSVSFDLDPTLR